jgi:hypothetical protein
MPKYHFHIDGPRPFADARGTTLPNDPAAWAKVCRDIRKIEASLRPSEDWRLEVTRDGKAVYMLTVSSRRM